MKTPWVTLAVFEILPTAEINRGRLLAEGVSCRLMDRSLSSLGLIANGIEIQVPEPELERAQKILAQDFSGDLDLAP
ncbi:MAG TPA: hypothetical protein DEP36_11130 [Gammaproteobacteria bacterium]|nr:DUF2007 domain-containing protein [Candidatus Competibacteraceae bacterium]MCP5135058.1 DUF2007 domain-containing protein [Gammaproteobacteria bacterium]HCB14102.1 hypothetical protein [Gammaproteobacteria bacterium]HRF44189.1 DUF2007 domain-containing protein [Candidatus Competibacteraceae bacterium]HRY18899.1 DUF2007 domain-containing protein [Candidatus Competibacteraceae bacterium]